MCPCPLFKHYLWPADEANIINSEYVEGLKSNFSCNFSRNFSYNLLITFLLTCLVNFLTTFFSTVLVTFLLTFLIPFLVTFLVTSLNLLEPAQMLLLLLLRANIMVFRETP